MAADVVESVSTCVEMLSATRNSTSRVLGTRVRESAIEAIEVATIKVAIMRFVISILFHGAYFRCRHTLDRLC